jgi:hypothetical protein
MKIIDNISHLLGDDIKASVDRGDRLKVAASCFSIFAFEALKAELQNIEGLDFIFTSPTFLPDDVTDQVRRERRVLHSQGPARAQRLRFGIRNSVAK